MAEVGIKIKATDEASSVFGKVATEAGKLQSSVASVGSSFAALGGAAVAGLSVITFATKIKESIDLADSFNKLSQKTGVAVDALSKLNYAAGLSDVSTEALSNGLKKLNLNISAAANGSAEQAGLFKALGISVKDVSGNVISADKVLAQLADRFAESGDGANKNAIAVAAFGKAGADLIPLLNAGAQGLGEMGDEAKKLGIVLGSEFSKNAEEFNDNIAKINLAGQGLFVTLAGDLVKGLGATVKAMADAAVEGGKFAAVMAGIQTLLTGDDQYKANVAMVKETEVLMATESALAKARAAGDTARIARLEKAVELRKQELQLTQNYRAMLEGDAKKREDDAKPKPTTDSAAIRAAARAISKQAGVDGPAKEKGNEFRGEQEAAKEWAKALEAAGKASADLVAKNMDLSKSQADLKAYMESAAAVINEKTNPAMNDMVRAALEANAALEALGKLADVIEAQQKRTSNAEDETRKERDRVAAIGLTTEAVAELGAARLEEMAIAKERALLAADEIDLSGEYSESIKAEAKALRERAALLRTGAAKETAIEAAKAEADERKRGWEETDRIARDVFTSWAEDGSSAAKKIGDTLRKALLSAIYEATLKPIAFQLYTSIAGGGGGSTALQAASSAGGAGNALSGVSSLFSAGGAIANGISNVGAAMINGPFSSLVGDLGASLVSNSAAIASAVPYVGAALIAIKALTDYKIEAKGNGITATIGGASGLPSGSVGQFREFAQTSSGVLSGGNTINRDWSVADQGVATYIAKNVQAITASNKAYADALGLTSGSIDAFTKNIEVNLTGLDAAGQQAAINAELAKFSGEQITAAYGDALKGVAKEGETTAQTLQRLGTDLTGVNAMFGDLGYTLYDVSVAGASAASTLATAFGGLAQAQGQLGNFYQNFYTKAEQEANAYRQVQADLDKAGLQVTVDQLRAASRDDIRAVVDQLAGNTGTADGAAQYAAAVKAANALAGVKPATPDATTAAKSFVDASLAALKNSVSAEKVSINAAYQSQADALNAQINTVGFGVDKLTTFADSLKGALSAMQITGDAGGARAVAQAQISDALMAARSGAALPTDGRLDGALSAVAQPSEQLFGSFEAYAQDFYKTANDIAGLNDLAEQQLTDAELMQQTLKDQLFAAKKYNDEQVLQLDALLVNAQAQLDATNGVNASVLSVADALRAFQDATRPGASVASRNPGPGRTQAEEEILQQSLRDNVLRNKQSDYSFDQIRDYVVATYDGSAASLQAIYAAAKVTRTTVADIAASLGVNAAYLTPYFREAGIPEFAVGTNYIPYDGYKAILHEGEAVVPKAYNPAAGGMAGSMDGGKTAAEVSMLRQDMRDSQAQIAVLMQRLVRINEKWDGEGQPEVRTVAA